MALTQFGDILYSAKRVFVYGFVERAAGALFAKYAEFGIMLAQ